MIIRPSMGTATYTETVAATVREDKALHTQGLRFHAPNLCPPTGHTVDTSFDDKANGAPGW